jgi:RNA polymerase sigma factor (TIGR02999 family)
MDRPNPQTVTALLLRWRDGEESALNQLMPLVYDELRRQAKGMMKGERRDHTLQATALIHEAYARLAGSELSIKDRSHFLSLSARAMRRVLVDHARARGREKRGGDADRITLVETSAFVPGSADKLVEIDDALERLKALDERKYRALEMAIFGGLQHTEIAEVLGVSVPTVERDLRTARAWLRSEL